MKSATLSKNTIPQLEAIKKHAKNLMSGENQLEDQIWIDDIAAVDNALEIIGAYRELKERAIILIPKRWNGSEWADMPKEEALRKLKTNTQIKELTSANDEKIFKPGQSVIYKPKNHKGEVYKEEPGIVKRMGIDGKVAFVWYHEGCTAAATPVEYLHESHTTVAHTKIHHGCEECVSDDPEALTEFIFE